MISIGIFSDADAYQVTTEQFTSGEIYYGRNEYVVYYAGSLPIILSAPHGGDLEPSEISDRTYGTTVRDSYTMETALAVRTAIFDLTGKYPHLVISRLRRTKLDPNREIIEAAQGNQYAEQAWTEYHNYIESAKDTVDAKYGRGLYLDLHGHGHAIKRLELGYLLSSSDLNLPDNTIDQTSYINKSSIRALVSSSGKSFSELLRGSVSLGALLSQYGIPSVPSPDNNDPGGNSYFSGGYSTQRHGSRDGGNISGIQIEMHYGGIRDTPYNRENYAESLAEILDEYMRVNFNLDIVTSVEPPNEAIPEDFYILQNYPNPFNPKTTIQFNIPFHVQTTLKIYSLSGKFIKTLVSTELPGGRHTVIWNSTNENGMNVGSGIYFYIINAGNFRAVKKMLILK